MKHPMVMRERARELRREGLGNAAIAREMGVGRQTIIRWIGNVPRGRNSICSGRKICAGPCGRWRHVSDYTPTRWKGDEVKYIHSRCRTCHNDDHRRRWHSMTPDQRLTRNEYNYRQYYVRRGTVPPEDRSEQAEKTRVALESFRPWWDLIRKEAKARYGYALNDSDQGRGQFSDERFRESLKLDEQEYQTLSRSMRERSTLQTVDAGLVDRVLTAADLPHAYATLYFVEPRFRG